MMELKITRVSDDAKRTKPKPEEKGFGKFYSDHMFMMDFRSNQGWIDPRIEPYRSLELDPAAMVFHYSQSAFEGLKAYPAKDGRILLFRPELNMRRMSKTLSRICVPEFDEEFLLESIKKLVNLDKDWIPTGPGESLYIRPTVIATEPCLGVRPAQEYMFYVITSPVGAYYPQGFAPMKIKVEETYVRSAVGGLGSVKASANYAASLLAQEDAHSQGWAQVLWLDAAERRFVEEVGTSNIFFVKNNAVITPELTGSILPGITRQSVLELCQEWGIPTEERPIDFHEIIDGIEKGSITEAFATGTAAIIAPKSVLSFKGVSHTLPGPQPGPLATRLYEELLSIQYGEKPDTRGWIVEV